MNEIFLSYRRDDTQTETLLLFEHLARIFGVEHVFQDQGIPPGDDFRAVLEQRLQDCRLLLAIIGPRWLDGTNRKRLHQENDWVRRELETALRSGKPVVPLFINCARPPCAADLPDGPLRAEFWSRQGRFVRTDNYLQSDLAAVRERIAECTGLAPREGDDAAWTYAPLPQDPDCFGRDAKHEQLVGQLLAETPAPVLVQGGPGFGKTTLTVHALHDPRVRARFPFRCFFVRCEAAPSVAALVDLLASAFQVLQTQHAEATLLRRLQELAPLVLVLDNAETPWHGQRRACEDFFARLAAVPLCRLVLTVRGKERPVGLAWQPPVEVDRLVPPFDRQMFLQLARSAFDADPALDRLLASLAGWPLPISLLAYQAQDYSDLTELERRWRKEKEKLLVVAGREDDFHYNFAASVELSVQSKREDEAARRLLSLLGMLPEGILRDDLDALLPDLGDPAASTLRKVELAKDDGPRLRVHPYLRDYLERNHAPSPEDRVRALHFYLQVARDGEKAGTSDGAAAIQRVTQELTNILFAVHVSLESAGPRAVYIEREAPRQGGTSGERLARCPVRVRKDESPICSEHSATTTQPSARPGRSERMCEPIGLLIYGHQTHPVPGEQLGNDPL